jgi:hypothetical protein
LFYRPSGYFQNCSDQYCGEFRPMLNSQVIALSLRILSAQHILIDWWNMISRYRSQLNWVWAYRHAFEIVRHLNLRLRIGEKLAQRRPHVLRKPLIEVHNLVWVKRSKKWSQNLCEPNEFLKVTQKPNLLRRAQLCEPIRMCSIEA